METGKPTFSARGGAKPVSSNVPNGGGGFPLSSAQTSGKTRHARGDSKIENLKGMPTLHGSGKQTFDSKVAKSQPIKV
jgi:hypothetical protein